MEARVGIPAFGKASVNVCPTCKGKGWIYGGYRSRSPWGFGSLVPCHNQKCTFHDRQPEQSANSYRAMNKGKREQFGYAWPEHYLDGLTFAPLPKDREIDPMALHEAMAQRNRRDRIAETIGRQLAEAILEAAEKNDTVRGYSSRDR